MVKWAKEITLILLVAIFSKGLAMARHAKRNAGDSSSSPAAALSPETASYCLSWRMAVESNNVRGWRTIPAQCWRHIETYMVAGQYLRDISMVVDQIYGFLDDISLNDDGLDAWILDVDDTCLSNLLYYRGKRFGCDPYNPMEFKTWALRGGCPAIPAVLQLFTRLVETGFKIILLTGRDEETLGEVTINNLEQEGFIGYDQLIMRSAEHRGQSAISYKTQIRKQLMDQGYRIWGNVGDQWSDLQGEYTGNRTFKLPNPMYCVP